MIASRPKSAPLIRCMVVTGITPSTPWPSTTPRAATDHSASDEPDAERSTFLPAIFGG
jgi:hypothetical protein